MKLVTDIKKIVALSNKNHDANWNFRSFLKGYDAPIEKIDAIVRELYEWISSEIDCKACANCCRKARPVLDQKDIRRLAKGLKNSSDDFKAMYLSSGDEPEGFVFKKTPCPFLKNNLCSHYDFRPTDCRSFPHLHKKEFVFRLWNVVENCSICPIVFNVYEHLKEELWHIDYNDFIDDLDS
jgi:Fe-S-cluster containining protein